MEEQARAHAVAIVGVNEESAAIFSALAHNSTLRVVKLLNTEYEDIAELTRIPGLDIIVNTTYDEEVGRQLQNLRIQNVDILSGLSARILFCSGQDGSLVLSNHEYRTKVMHSLREIQRAVHVAHNKEELLKLVLNVTIQSSNADSGSIMLLDKEKHQLTIETANGLPGDVVVSTMQKLGKGVAGRVVKTRLPMLITGPANKSMILYDHERNELASSMCCPLMVGNDVIGVLNINSKVHERLFSNEDLEYAMELAAITADIIQASRQYVASARTSFLLGLVNSIRDIMNLGFPIYERLNLACMKVANAFDADFCKYYEYDADGRVFLTRASSSLDLNLLKGRKTKLNHYTTDLVLQNNRTLCLKASHAEGGVQQWHIAQPVKISERLLGLLVVQVLSAKDDLKEEIDILEKVGGVLAREYDRHGQLEQSRIQAVKFSVISEISFTFAHARDLKGLAEMVVSNACLILEAENCVLRLPDPATGDLRVFNSFSFKPHGHLQKVEELDEKVLDELLTSRGLLYHEDLQRTRFVADTSGCVSVLAMSFFRENKIIGTLSVYDKRPGSVYDTHAFTLADKDVFLNLCLQVSKGLQRFL